MVQHGKLEKEGSARQVNIWEKLGVFAPAVFTAKKELKNSLLLFGA
jgi:Mn-dependent DtxR family transcriptional regulator